MDLVGDLRNSIMASGLPTTRDGGMGLKITIFTIQKTIHPLSFWVIWLDILWEELTSFNPFYTQKKQIYL
jgi:hypothetical protein